MNRRGFFRALAVGAVTGVVATPALVELLTPKRTIFLPPRGGWILTDIPVTLNIEIATGEYLDFIARTYGITRQEAAQVEVGINNELYKVIDAQGPIFYDDSGLRVIENGVERALSRI